MSNRAVVVDPEAPGRTAQDLMARRVPGKAALTLE